MVNLRQLSFRLTPEDIAILDEAQRRYGLGTRTEALRYLLRQWEGAAEVLERTTSKPKARRKKR